MGGTARGPRADQQKALTGWDDPVLRFGVVGALTGSLTTSSAGGGDRNRTGVQGSFIATRAAGMATGRVTSGPLSAITRSGVADSNAWRWAATK